jgi:hypothetical protein
MKTLTTKEATQILIKEFESDDTLKVHEMKGYKKAVKFIKQWSNKLDFLTFKTDKTGLEMIVNIKSCSVC